MSLGIETLTFLSPLQRTGWHIKTSHPPPRKGCEGAGRRHCWSLRGAGVPETFLGSTAAEYMSETFSAVPQMPSAARRKDVPREGHTSPKSGEAAEPTREGCCLPPRDAGGLYSNPQGKSSVQRMEIRMGLIHKALLTPVTLTGLSNYRTSRKADTCNSTELV